MSLVSPVVSFRRRLSRPFLLHCVHATSLCMLECTELLLENCSFFSSNLTLFSSIIGSNQCCTMPFDLGVAPRKLNFTQKRCSSNYGDFLRDRVSKHFFSKNSIGLNVTDFFHSSAYNPEFAVELVPQNTAFLCHIVLDRSLCWVLPSFASAPTETCPFYLSSRGRKINDRK